MTYAEGGILDSSPKDILIQTAFKHDCKGAEIFIKPLQIEDLAWVLALKKAGVDIKDELIDALVTLKDFELNPKYGDIYNSKNVALDIYNSKNVALKKLTKYAKDLHISRPRREAINVAFYLKLKDELVDFSNVLKELGKIFIQTALKYQNTIMPDFTYLHHAQPTTFGHYILTFLFPILRDFERIEVLYRHLNRSVAGSGSVNGCSFEIDRNYLAKLLDMQEVEYHSRDGMWRSDIPIEAVYIINSVISNIARITDELQIFSTAEFSMIELPSSLSRASVIMPNKQNPYALTYIRGVANEMVGKMASFISYEKIVSGNPDSRTFVYVDLIESLRKVKDALRLFGAVLNDMKIKEDVLSNRVKNSFMYATDIAEWLIKHKKMTYEEAHTEVGRVIRYMKENSIEPKDIKKEFFSVEIEELDKLINPFLSVKRKKTVGGVGDLKNIIKKADNQIDSFDIKKGDFSFLEKELKDLGYEIKLAT